jgi:hypothetical protein
MKCKVKDGSLTDTQKSVKITNKVLHMMKKGLTNMLVDVILNGHF